MAGFAGALAIDLGLVTGGFGSVPFARDHDYLAIDGMDHLEPGELARSVSAEFVDNLAGVPVFCGSQAKRLNGTARGDAVERQRDR
jgi:hypothetical protein